MLHKTNINNKPKNVVILGATGSIGATTLGIIRAFPERFRVVAMTANGNVDKLSQLAREFLPDLAIVADESGYETLKNNLSGTGIKTAAGKNALIQAAQMPADIVMAAMVGMAGLPPVLAAIRQGTTIALANKETLVAAGELVLAECKKHNATLLPVDS